MLTIIILIAAFLGVATLVVGVTLIVRGSGQSEAADRLDVLTGAMTGRREDEEQKSVLNEPLDDRPGFMETFVSRFLNLRAFLDQGDVNITPSKFLIVTGGMALAAAAVCVAFRIHPALILPAALLMGALPLGWVYLKRRKRLRKFGQQLPDALELISRALRAGHSLAAGFHLVGTEMSAPIGKEFQRVYDEQNLGIPLEEALDEMTDRVPNLDLRFFATAVVIQRQSGGDLAEILNKIGHLVRERFKIFGQVQALTGEGRLSGIVLLALPPVLFLVMLRLNSGYVMTLFEDELGKQMLAVAIVLQAVGALVIRKIVNIRV